MKTLFRCFSDEIVVAFKQHNRIIMKPLTPLISNEWFALRNTLYENLNIDLANPLERYHATFLCLDI